MILRKKFGDEHENIESNASSEDKIKYINFKLAYLGLPIFQQKDDVEESSSYIVELFDDIIMDYKEKNRIASMNKIGINKRINKFLSNYFKDFEKEITVIDDVFTLDHYGLARELSLPPNGSEFINEYISSYKIKQGILNNPKHDRRTTKGSFHIAEGGLKVPFDKKTVPKETFFKLYKEAINPPEELKILPFTANQNEKAKTFVSLLIKPMVSPEVPGIAKEKTMEILIMVPGSMVSSLDFLESVFGNAGNPGMHLNDSGLDVDNWTGHTGYIILAPHLIKIKKIDVGLPHYDDATEIQRKDGMCYKNENELYNDGSPCKLTCRDASGVAVTIIADNYFGYAKKEVKTQISYASNLYGNVEEEHSGGTIAFPRTNLGETYNANENIDKNQYSFDYIKKNYSAFIKFEDDNYGIDKKNTKIIYLPENVEISLYETEIKWEYKGAVKKLKLLPEYIYILPNGDKIHMEQHPFAPAWKLTRTKAEGTFCHKPCTVSGGGKSEISKSLNNSIIYGTYYVNELEKDLDFVEKILNYDYRKRWKVNPERVRHSREILSAERTLGSVIKLLTPSASYTDEFNEYLKSIPNHIKALVFMVKRFYRQSWKDKWRDHFTVDLINGKPGNEINFNNRKIRPSFLRVGFANDASWRVFKLRMDFMPSEKIQTEDDISVSIVLPSSKLNNMNPEYNNYSYKFTKNCEYRLFQRPDEAINKGYDKQAEKDLSDDNLFVTNYAPLTKDDVVKIKEDAMGYVFYTNEVKIHIDDFLNGNDKYCIVSSVPRMVEGEYTKNPRYLEDRSDLVNPDKNYISEIGVRLARKIPIDKNVLFPVNAVLPGRRNNPPSMENGKKILPLSVYNPIHFQELPELFMDYISSLTGKSPSTTGAGSEGALTKGPFNMLLPMYDLNTALVSYILTDYYAFTTPAGHIGPNIRVDHDISILIPEVWSKLTVEERDPYNMIKKGALEKIEDFEYNGAKISASRLGYRITEVFSYKYLGKIFDDPQTIFTENILRPEKQDLEAYIDGVVNIIDSQKKAASVYFDDGSIDEAILPLKALLHIMVYGEYKGNDINSKEVRDLFKKENILNTKWYKKRLKNKQEVEIKLIKKKISNLNKFISYPTNKYIVSEYKYVERLEKAKKELEYLKSNEYLESLIGTLGASNVV